MAFWARLAKSRQIWPFQCKRPLFSLTGVWPSQLTKERQLEIETYWKEKLKQIDEKNSRSVAECDGTKTKAKQYVLSMFPYPSGKLHMGHVRVYTISDVLARFHRMNGKAVIHPMGWDAFGLPAENAAIDNGENPQEWTYRNIDMMRSQLQDLCCSFDWSREFATCDPSYYKWTQMLFLKLFDAGLVYQKESAVHWDPVDQTVLADEQIDANGCSWRSGAKVERRFLRQWYIRATAFSKALYDGLKDVNEEQWKDVVDLQKNWIGECTGVRWQLSLERGGKVLSDPLFVYTTRPELIYGVSHITLTKHHPLCVRSTSGISKTDLHAIHPLTGHKLPVFANATVDVADNQEALFGIPNCSEDDKRLADEHGVTYEHVLDDSGLHLVYPEELKGLSYAEASKIVAAKALELKCGHVCSERSRDWLISRQRYWGTPIPIVHCPKHGAVPVPVEQLPIVLPPHTAKVGRGGSVLKNMDSWRTVKCPKCGDSGHALRETDTMDTFVDSSWYYLRYLDPHNTRELISKEACDKYMPVDIYIGGKEHATMHLYYARLVSHFLHSVNMASYKEPFANLLTQGMVLGQSFRRQDSNKYLRPAEVVKSGDTYVDQSSGTPVVVDWEKMSKSKYNGIDPEAVIKEHGTDASRLCIVHNVAPKTDRNWTSDDFVGILRWQQRLWSLIHDFRQQKLETSPEDAAAFDSGDFQFHEDTVQESRNYFVAEVTRHVERTFLLNVAISRLQGFTNALKKYPVKYMGRGKQFELALFDLAAMMFPFSPLFASELWAGLVNTPNRQLPIPQTLHVSEYPWPQISQDKASIRVKINSKTIATIPVEVSLSSLSAESAFELVRTYQKLQNVDFSAKKAMELRVLSELKADLQITVAKEKKQKIKKAAK